LLSLDPLPQFEAGRRCPKRLWPPGRYDPIRPVEAMQTWLAAAEISSGPVFRAELSDAPLANHSAARIVMCYARHVGLDYAGHSLRSGFLTSAAEAGASIRKLSEVSRPRT
jgi:hypothetical protein